VQELRQQEDCDERNYLALSVAEIRLIHQHWVGNGGRVEEGERGVNVGVIPMIVQKYGGDVERDQDENSWKRMTNNIEVRESGTN
jgi:hypothetical protein